MPGQIINIIRELSDRVMKPQSDRRSTFCEEINPPGRIRWEPNTDIMESDEAVIIRCEVAGVQKDDICIKLAQGKLIIMGVRDDRRPARRVDYHRLEINYGHFAKIINIPESIEHNEINARLQDGLLDIYISKKSRVIEIPITMDGSSEE